MNIDTDLKIALSGVLKAAIEDYMTMNYTPEMLEEFAKGFEYNVGKKYIRIMNGTSAWAFVVAVDNDKKFKRGDILKCAGWKSPARNAARGNCFEDFSVNWTGPHYL